LRKSEVNRNISGGVFDGVDVTCSPLFCKEYLPKGIFLAFT